MCKAMGLQAIYGSQGGMDEVADWLTEQKQAGIKLLGVKRSTIQNWESQSLFQHRELVCEVSSLS